MRLPLHRVGPADGYPAMLLGVHVHSGAYPAQVAPAARLMGALPGAGENWKQDVSTKGSDGDRNEHADECERTGLAPPPAPHPVTRHARCQSAARQCSEAQP